MNDFKPPILTRPKNDAILSITTREHGQAMVETAFVMIILLMLLSVIIDLGRAFFIYSVLQNAVAEGAYYAAKEPGFKDSTDNPDPNNIIFRVKHESPDSPLINWDPDGDEVSVTYWCAPTPVDIDNPTQEELNRERTSTNVPSGAFVVVRAFYTYKAIGPIAGMMALVLPDAFSDWDGSFPLRAETKLIVLEQHSTQSIPCH